MSMVLVWLRHYLRLHDQYLLPLVCRQPDVQGCTRWGFPPFGPYRRAWLTSIIKNPLQRLQNMDYQRWILNQPVTVSLPALARSAGAATYEPEGAYKHLWGTA